jgi:cobalt-zinc-cadmium resistance protein CzcA
LSHRKIMVAIGAGFLIGIGILVPQLGTEFLPHLEEGNLWIRVTMPPTISLEAGVPLASRLREILRSHPEVITVVSQHGRPDDGSDAAGFNNLELFASLKPFEQWPAGLIKEDLIKKLQSDFSNEFVGIGLNFSQYIQDNVEEQLSGVKGANSVKIIGRDLGVLERIAGEVMHEMARVKGVTDLGLFPVLGQPNLNIKVDRDKAARYGLNAGDVNSLVQAALGGTPATTLLEADRQFNVTVRLAPEYRQDRRRAHDQGRLPNPGRHERLHSIERTRQYFSRYRRVLHLSRAARALYANQVQRARPRSRQHGRGSAATDHAQR